VISPYWDLVALFDLLLDIGDPSGPKIRSHLTLAVIAVACRAW
jgi:hypothetical protein